MINLVCPSVWKIFIDSNSKFIKSEMEMLIHNFFSNKLNLLEYNEFVKSNISDYFSNNDTKEYDYEDVINQIILSLNDNDRIVHSTKVDIGTDLLSFFNSSSISNLLLIQSDQDDNVDGTINYSKLSKFTFSWLFANLLSQPERNGMTLNFNDFKDNNQLKSVIGYIYKVKRNKDKVVHIQNSYKNLKGILEIFKNQKVIYYSSTYIGVNRKNNSQINSERIELKTFFGKNCTVKYSSDKSLTHPRLILFNQISIKFDHDFNEINLGNKNWNMTISTCPNRKQEVYDILNMYN